jgi:hypothetical protein
MTTRPVPPVIPAASPGRRPGKPGAGHPMPLASPPGRPDVVYGFGRIDATRPAILCVPRTSSTSCDQAIFIDHATGASLSMYAALLQIDRLG